MKLNPNRSRTGSDTQSWWLPMMSLTASDGPGPKLGHTGWPPTMVFSMITYEPTGTWW